MRTRLAVSLALLVALSAVGAPVAAQDGPVFPATLMKDIEPELTRLTTTDVRLTRTVTAGAGPFTEVVAEYRVAPATIGAELRGEDASVLAGLHHGRELLFTRRGGPGMPWAVSVAHGVPWFAPDPSGADPEADAAQLAPLVATLAGPIAELLGALGAMTSFTRAADPACPETCVTITGATAAPLTDPATVVLALDSGRLTGATLNDADGTQVVLAWDPVAGDLLAAPSPLTPGLPDGLVPAGAEAGQVAIDHPAAHRLIAQALGRAWNGDLLVTEKTLKGSTTLGTTVTTHAAKGDWNTKRTLGSTITGARVAGANAWLLASDGVWQATKDRTLVAPYAPAPAAQAAALTEVRWSGIRATTECATGSCYVIAGLRGAARSQAFIDAPTGRLLRLDLRGLPSLAAGTRRDIAFTLPAKTVKVSAPTVTARTPTYKLLDDPANPGVACIYFVEGVDMTLVGVQARAPKVFAPVAPGATGSVGWRTIVQVKQGKKWAEVLRGPLWKSLATATTAASMPADRIEFVGTGPLLFQPKPYRVVAQITWYRPDGKTLKVQDVPYVHYYQQSTDFTPITPAAW
ncbi:MAG: hypothetical protein ACKOTZ_05630 [Chloroflexota bacterium]